MRKRFRREGSGPQREIGEAGRQQADTCSFKFRFPFCGAKIRIHDIKVNKSDFFCFGGFKCNVESKLCFAGAEIADNYKIFFILFIHAFIERCTAVFVSEDNLPAVSAAHGFKTGNNAFGGTHSVNRRAHDSAGIACTFADRVKTLSRVASPFSSLQCEQGSLNGSRLRSVRHHTYQNYVSAVQMCGFRPLCRLK